MKSVHQQQSHYLKIKDIKDETILKQNICTNEYTKCL